MNATRLTFQPSSKVCIFPTQKIHKSSKSLNSGNGKRYLRPLLVSNPSVTGEEVATSVKDLNMDSLADSLVPILFTVATIALGVVTIGVIYLNASSWLESRTENKEKSKKEEYDEEMKTFMESAQKSKSKPKTPIKKATDKGFGSS